MREASEIDGIALRVVAPGTYFQRHARVDEPYLNELGEAVGPAPLHCGPVLSEALALRKRFPSAALWGISDSAFHATLPPVAREYALPVEDASRWDIHRFGYHGISAQSVLEKLKRRGPLPGRMIRCHLGGGASVMAIHDGKSMDVSMGFSPLEGLLMGTRIGDIDPAAILHLERKAGMDADAIGKYLNTRCGLLGLSGTSVDMRKLLESEAEGDTGAALAVEAFVYRVRKYIGAYTAALGGIDLLVFTAAIGERSPLIRARICRGLEWMGVHLDPVRNDGSTTGDAELQPSGYSTGVSVVLTDEAVEMHRLVRKALDRR